MSFFARFFRRRTPLTFTMTFRNLRDAPLWLQVDPWANVYCIEPRQQFSIVAEGEANEPLIDVDWHETGLIVSLNTSTAFYVLQNGRRLHHLRDFRTNVENA